MKIKIDSKEMRVRHGPAAQPEEYNKPFKKVESQDAYDLILKNQDFVNLNKNSFALSVLNAMVDSTREFRFASIADLIENIKLRQRVIDTMKAIRSNPNIQYPQIAGGDAATGTAGKVDVGKLPMGWRFLPQGTNTAWVTDSGGADAVATLAKEGGRLDCLARVQLAILEAVRVTMKNKDDFNTQVKRDIRIGYFGMTTEDDLGTRASPAWGKPSSGMGRNIGSTLVPGDWVVWFNDDSKLGKTDPGRYLIKHPTLVPPGGFYNADAMIYAGRPEGTHLFIPGALDEANKATKVLYTMDEVFALLAKDFNRDAPAGVAAKLNASGIDVNKWTITPQELAMRNKYFVSSPQMPGKGN